MEGQEEGSCSRRSRKNTAEEKRRMRNERKRRKRSKTSRISALKGEIQHEQHLKDDMEKRVSLYRNMSRSYWERWQWELQQRRQCIIRSKCPLPPGSSKTSMTGQFQEINPSMLSNLNSSAKDEDAYIGRGSFAVVKLQSFRGLKVAVKELLPRTLLTDVFREASILIKLSHPYVPYLFGVCTREKPYRIVMQFEGVVECDRPLTLQEAVLKKRITSGVIWLKLCAQLMEGLRYLHEEVEILHNDIKPNNILISETGTVQSSTCTLSVVLIDFGKASLLDQGKKYYLSWIEKAEHTRKYPHLAPELIDGVTKETKKTDMFSAGGVIQRVVDSLSFTQLPVSKQNSITTLATNCRSPNYFARPSAKAALDTFKMLV